MTNMFAFVGPLFNIQNIIIQLDSSHFKKSSPIFPCMRVKNT